MPDRYPVYLELGSKRVFAGALDWPGWCRSGRDETAALEALVHYGPRYKRALARAATGFKPPKDASELDIVERLKGNATTDFGAPAIPPRFDEEPADRREARRLPATLKASWMAFDRSAEAAEGVELRKGPRGGGRDLDKIIRHVLEAEAGYLPKIGGRHRPAKGSDIADDVETVRTLVLETVAARLRGESMPAMRASPWSLRYFIRRDVWHVLDHAWEIEDRASPAR